MPTLSDTIEITVDKSHIITIGERLYSESIELIRELVNNAYDADATEVHVFISDDHIIVEDDGFGMDLKGLKQYFNIGSQFKRNARKSPKYGRDRIGEFGIGKFASLSACSTFELWTKKDDFQAKVTFDKEEWNKSGDLWHIPLEIEEPDPRHTNGTKVTLLGLTKKFNIADVEKRILESVPLKAPHFVVFINNRKINPRFIPGHTIPFLEGTEYGIVHGEIIITSQSMHDIAEAGIECKVKQVTIIKDFFGLDKLINNIARIRGEVHADFLLITSDRTGFIKDTSQYTAFIEAMNRVVESIKPVLHNLSDYKENKHVRKTLNKVLEMVKNALILNPDFCPESLMPIGDASSPAGQPGHIVQQRETGDNVQAIALKQKKKRKKKFVVKRLNPTAVVKKLKYGLQGISCCIDHFGAESTECFTEGTIIYLNRDHPLYRKAVAKRDTHTFHIARLLTQEIALMKYPRNPRQAFQRQSKLLRDALISKKEEQKQHIHYPQ